jgi:hypothetical protein
MTERPRALAVPVGPAFGVAVPHLSDQVLTDHPLPSSADGPQIAGAFSSTMVRHVVEHAVADCAIAWLFAHQFPRDEHAPSGVQQAIVRVLLEHLTSFVEAGFKLLQQVASRLPLLRLELRAAGRIDVQLVHIHHHVEQDGMVATIVAR